MSKHRIVIDLYDHTSATEAAEIIEALRRIGIDGARFESPSDACKQAVAEQLAAGKVLGY